jgi:hypothetical protein
MPHEESVKNELKKRLKTACLAVSGVNAGSFSTFLSFVCGPPFDGGLCVVQPVGGVTDENRQLFPFLFGDGEVCRLFSQPYSYQRVMVPVEMCCFQYVTKISHSVFGSFFVAEAVIKGF